MQKIEGFIDRIEDGYAVVEDSDRKMHNIPKRLLPKGVKAGDHIRYIDRKYVIDQAETEKLKARIEDLAKNLWD